MKRQNDPLYTRLKMDQKVAIDHQHREYDLFIPSQLDSINKYPLVISLHGHFGSKEDGTGRSGKKSPQKIWMDVGEREKVFVAYPQGNIGGDGHRGWNGCRADALSNPESDDVEFLSTLIGDLIKQYPIDPRQVYIAGMSNGGGMAYRMGAEAPHLIAAIAIIIFNAPAQSECTAPKHPISVLLMNGTNDPLSPYEGGIMQKGKISD